MFTYDVEAITRDRVQRREAQASLERALRTAAIRRSGVRRLRPARSTNAG
jgi:hypothetical protein